MDAIEKLIGYYNKSEEENIYHEVAGSILKNIHRVEESTIYDLAEMCYSSTSTISRLVKKLEFENFTEFKIQVQFALKNYRLVSRNTRDVEVIGEDEDVLPIFFNYLTNNINNLKDIVKYETIKEISDSLHNAKQILFFSNVPVNNVQKGPIIMGKETYVYVNMAEQEKSIERVEEGTVIYAIVPNMIEHANMRSILRKAKDKGAFIIGIIAVEDNNYFKNSDIQINFNSTKSGMDKYLFYIINDLVFSDYHNRYVYELIEEKYD